MGLDEPNCLPAEVAVIVLGGVRVAVEPKQLRKLPRVTRNSKSGRGGRIRTGGPLRPRQVRYQAALRPDL
jgi:hypothetical protein